MLPQLTLNYGIAELELTCLICNMHGFIQLLKHQYFEALVDHSPTEKSMKRKERANNK